MMNLLLYLIISLLYHNQQFKSVAASPTITIHQTICPERCNCTSRTLLDCMSRSLENVPANLTAAPSLTIIDLSGNHIVHITNEDFRYYNQNGNYQKNDNENSVSALYLNDSNVNVIEEGAFVPLPNLQELYLGSNLLNSLPGRLIAQNRELILLELSGNLFGELPRLVSSSLEVLAAANADIQHISIGTFDALPHLKTLLLPENNLRRIDERVFNAKVLNTLAYVTLAHNPWTCDCGTVELFEYLVDEGVVELGGNFGGGGSWGIGSRDDEMVQCFEEESGRYINVIDSSGRVLPTFQICRTNPNNTSKDVADTALETGSTVFTKVDSGKIQSQNSKQLNTSLNDASKKSVESNTDDIWWLVVLGVAGGIAICFLLGCVAGIACMTSFIYYRRRSNLNYVFDYDKREVSVPLKHDIISIDKSFS